MSSLKRRLLFGLFGLALLSVFFWYGYEFLHLAGSKQSRHAASSVCAAMQIGMTVEQAIALAKSSKNKHRLTVSSEALNVEFGQNCACIIRIEEEKVSGKIAGCNR